MVDRKLAKDKIKAEAIRTFDLDWGISPTVLTLSVEEYGPLREKKNLRFYP